MLTPHLYPSRPFRQPQRRMNPALRDIVKEELQKLLNVNLIYPISDNRWVSPLIVVPIKNGKWWIWVNYRELKKATLRDYFRLPFMDQVLDTLSGKKYFSFLDGFSGNNQIQITPEDQEKTTFTFPWATYAYRVLPFKLCNAPTTFQRDILGFFCRFDSWLCQSFYGRFFQLMETLMKKSWPTWKMFLFATKKPIYLLAMKSAEFSLPKE